MLLKQQFATLRKRVVWVLIKKNEQHMRPKMLSANMSFLEMPTRHLGTSSSIDEFRKREESREKAYDHLSTIEKNEKPNYHYSTDKDTKTDKLNDVKTKILEASLRYVPSLGWSRNALIRGAEDVGLPSVVHGMFPEGGYVLVSYYYGKCNLQLLAMLQKETNSGQKKVSDPTDFAYRAIRARLEMSLPYKSQWPQAMALMAAPQNASNALAQLLTLVDDICYYGGDRSVSVRWYTRRLGIATIMKITELFMLQDTSQGHVNTWEFLKVRLEEAMRLQSFLKQSEGATRSIQNSFSNAFETARNILGVGYERRS